MEAKVAEVAPEPQPSSRGLIASILSDAQRLVALEIALARQEMKELAVANSITLAVIAFGGLLALLAILVALPVVVVLLVPWKWEAAAVWAGAYAVVGLVMVFAGRTRLRFQLPPRTIESLKENKEWALRRVKSNSR